MTHETPRTDAAGTTFLEMQHIAKQLESELQGTERRITMLREDRDRLVEENQELLSKIEESKDLLKEALRKLQEAGVRE
jgi:hypothetical protein